MEIHSNCVSFFFFCRFAWSMTQDENSASIHMNMKNAVTTTIPVCTFETIERLKNFETTHLYHTLRSM